MKHIFKKYEFASEEVAETRIAALPSDDEGNPTHKHTVVKLGYLWKTTPEYDEEGNISIEGVQSDKYSVDVLWNVADITSVDAEAVLDEDGMVVTPARNIYCLPLWMGI